MHGLFGLHGGRGFGGRHGFGGFDVGRDVGRGGVGRGCFGFGDDEGCC